MLRVRTADTDRKGVSGGDATSFWMTTSRAHELVPTTLWVRGLSRTAFGASVRVPATFCKMPVTTQVAAEGGTARD